MIKKCLGCGVKLQSVDESLKGYIPSNVLNKGYCKRCFMLTHYNNFVHAYYEIEPEKILKKLANKKGFGIFILDLVNFNKEAFNYYRKIKMPKVLVVNKCDIIPKNISYLKIKNWLKKEFKVEEEIFFVSVKKNIGLNKLNRFLDNINLPLYFLGMSNVGKSSLINKLFNLEKPLTSSILPNTTLDFIKVKTSKNVYDTVGFLYQTKIDHNLLKKTMIYNEIHPINMPLKEESGLLILDLARIITDKKNSITCFFSKDVNIRKIYNNENIYLDEKPLIIKCPKESNLIIKGIGFCYVKEECLLKIYHLDEDLIELIPSFLGGQNE